MVAGRSTLKMDFFPCFESGDMNGNYQAIFKSVAALSGKEVAMGIKTTPDFSYKQFKVSKACYSKNR